MNDKKINDKQNFPVLMDGVQKDIDVFVKVYNEAMSVTGWSDGTLSFNASHNASLIKRIKRGVVAPATMSRILINLNAIITTTKQKRDAGLLR